MSKPSASRKFMPAGWVVLGSIVAIAVVATAGIVVAGSAKSNSHRTALDTTASLKPILGSRTATPPLHDSVRASYAALPLAFEANEGQTDAQVRYVARGSGYKLSLTSRQAIISLPGRKSTSEVRDMMMNKRRGAGGVKAMLKKRAVTNHRESSTAVVRMNLLGANPHTELTAENRQQGIVNYFLGNDPSKWKSNIALYGQVTYRQLYPGVDLAFHGAGKQLEFDYLVSPQADAAPIALSFEGAESMRTDGAGDLVLATSAGPVQLHKPVAYQSKNGARQAVDARFVVNGKNQVAFELGSYDHTRELVIDPTVTYSTYFGGDFADYGISIAVDGSGNAYVAGATDSDTIPAPGGGTVSPTNNGSLSGAFDTFVTKIGPTGTCIFTTFFGGTNDDFPGGIAIDSQGVYISGTTDSSDFPVTGGAAQTVFLGGTTNGANDAYAVKLALSNGAFTWGTYIGGSDSDSGLGVAVDSGHNVYVVGETFSQNLGGALGGVNHLPNGSAVNLNTGSGPDDGYIVKLNSGGTAYALVSYIGGSSGDLATGVALDGSGNIYVSGETISIDLPTTAGVVQATCGTDGTCNTGTSGAQDDAFVVSIKADLSNYNYVTYYGGSSFDDAFAIAADASGNSFITGTTGSTDLLSPGTPFQSTLLGAQNAFIIELNSTGSSATYSSYFGGDGIDLGYSIALDASDNVYLTGQTTSSSTTFPLLNATQAVGSGNSDAFVSVLGLSQGQLLFSTFLGGGGDEDQFEGGIALDSAQNIYVTGDTDSGNGTTLVFPTTVGSISGTFGGGTCLNSGSVNVPCTDAFVTAYGPATTADFAIVATTPAVVSPGTSGTSTVTLTALNAYALPVNLTCSVSGTGSPAPACSATSFSTNPVTPSGSGATTTLTITTTAPGGAAMVHHAKSLPALWLPVVGISIFGITFVSARAGRRKTVGFLLLCLVMGALFLLPSCGGSSSGGGGGTCAAAPSVPAGLAASSTTDIATTLTWTASTVGANCTAGYTIYQGGTQIGTSTTPTFNVTGLTASTTYNFTVAATDTAGASVQSAPLSVTTLSAATPAGNYTITITGTDANNLAHSTQVTLTVN